MAGFAYTVTSISQSLVVGNIYRALGTWEADGDAAGTIDTGLSKVLFHSVAVDTGTITSQVAEKANVTHVPAASDGKIGIITCAVDNEGTWEAMGKL